MPAITPNPTDAHLTQTPWRARAQFPSPPSAPNEPLPGHEDQGLGTEDSPPRPSTPATSPPSPPPDLQDSGPSTQDSSSNLPDSAASPSTPHPDDEDQGRRTKDSPPLPALSPTDAALLDQFIAAHESLHRLAEDTGKPLRTLTAWADSPSIAPWVARVKAERITYRRELSLAYLESIVKEPQNPVEGRRAANSLLKHTSPTYRAASPEEPVPRPGLRRRRFQPFPQPDTTPDPSTAANTPEAVADRPRRARMIPIPSSPPPPTRDELFSPAPNRLAPIPNQPLPNPSHPPETVIDTVIAALTTPDAPTPGAGAIALHNFHHRHAHDRDPSAPARTLAHLQGETPDAFIIKSIEPGLFIPGETTGWCAHEAIIETQANERLLLRINLHQPSYGTFGNCWMLFDITIRAPHIPYNPYLHPTTKDWPKHMRPRAP